MIVLKAAKPYYRKRRKRPVTGQSSAVIHGPPNLLVTKTTAGQWSKSGSSGSGLLDGMSIISQERHPQPPAPSSLISNPNSPLLAAAAEYTATLSLLDNLKNASRPSASPFFSVKSHSTNSMGKATSAGAGAGCGIAGNNSASLVYPFELDDFYLHSLANLKLLSVANAAGAGAHANSGLPFSIEKGNLFTSLLCDPASLVGGVTTTTTVNGSSGFESFENCKNSLGLASKAVKANFFENKKATEKWTLKADDAENEKMIVEVKGSNHENSENEFTVEEEEKHSSRGGQHKNGTQMDVNVDEVSEEEEDANAEDNTNCRKSDSASQIFSTVKGRGKSTKEAPPARPHSSSTSTFSVNEVKKNEHLNGSDEERQSSVLLMRNILSVGGSGVGKESCSKGAAAQHSHSDVVTSTSEKQVLNSTHSFSPQFTSSAQTLLPFTLNRYLASSFDFSDNRHLQQHQHHLLATTTNGDHNGAGHSQINEENAGLCFDHFGQHHQFQHSHHLHLSDCQLNSTQEINLRLLVLTIQWIKNMPLFSSLSLCDQVLCFLFN